MSRSKNTTATQLPRTTEIEASSFVCASGGEIRAPAPARSRALTLIGVVLRLQLQLFPLQLQELHLDLQVLLLRFQRIFELDEFLKGAKGTKTP